MKFLDTCQESYLPVGLKKRILHMLVKKTFHARVEANFRLYKQTTIDRHVEGTNDESLRGRIKSLTSKNTMIYAKQMMGLDVPNNNTPINKRKIPEVKSELHKRLSASYLIGPSISPAT